MAFCDVVGKHDSNDSKHNMHELNLKEGEDDLNTHKEEQNVNHPETLLSLPISPGLKEYVTVRYFLNVCATGSLIDCDFFE